MICSHKIGACHTPLERYSQDLKMVYLVIVDQGGQKNRNGKTTVVLFAMFSASGLIRFAKPNMHTSHPKGLQNRLNQPKRGPLPYFYVRRLTKCKF